ncbi:Hsp20/alpha crystallin family protein [Halomonas faecis]|uniref:Hsp20/alpha crystallin family protein n=1 Tax=Halomonas faecis TaxID=1562110 RepID=UPI001F093BC4|nr:Hsp20/alpha crystallin family protein [Halomonas faecis]
MGLSGAGHSSADSPGRPGRSKSATTPLFEAESGEQAHFRRERGNGEFIRTVALPDGLDADRAEAHCRNGVVEIHLPKREELKPRRIEVQAA